MCRLLQAAMNKLQHGFINAKCSNLCSVTRNGDIETIKLRDQDGSLRAKCSRDMSNSLQVVGILDLEDISEFRAGKINTLLSGTETRIIHDRRRSHAGNHLSGIRIQNIKLGGLASSNIQTMIGGIERDRGQTFGVCN